MYCLRALPSQLSTHSHVPAMGHTVGGSRRMLRRAIHALLLGVVVLGSAVPDPASAAERSAVKPLVGSPQVVKDPHWGDVLFYFYQGDYLQALTRLSASQEF